MVTFIFISFSTALETAVLKLEASDGLFSALTPHGPIPRVALEVLELQASLASGAIFLCRFECIAVGPRIGILQLSQPKT